MAIVVSNVIPDAGSDFYEQVTGKLGIQEQLPDGCTIHIASPAEGGWRVVTVWDSREQFERFREEQLLPAVREVAGDQAPAPQPEVQEVHRLITA